MTCKTPLPSGTTVCPHCRSLQPRQRTTTLLTPGLSIDRGHARLVVDARIGSGAMGTVFRGWLFYAPHGPLGGRDPVPVAIKQLNPDVAENEELRALFHAEAQALAQLAHPNVVGFLEMFEWAPEAVTPTAVQGAPVTCPVIVMEFVHGSSLEDVIARNVARAKLAGGTALPGLPFQRAWYYFQQLLGALAATHALHIVHRDVKPANIMIRHDGIAKLTDFGIARVVRPGGVAPNESFTPGTGAYMAPEQVVGLAVDGRTDLYAAAIVLFEMLAGRLPFPIEGRSELAVRIDQVEATPPKIRTFLPQAPPVLDALMDRALAKDPAHRFASAIEMGEAFRTALQLPETPAWRAQAEIAQVAAARSQTQRLAPPEHRKLATLRQVLVDTYKTQTLGSRR